MTSVEHQDQPSGRGVRSGLACAVATGVVIFGAATPLHAQWETLSGRFTVHVNAAYQTASDELRQTFAQRAYGEDATFEAVHEIQSGPMIDVGGSVRMWRELSVGALYSDFNKADSTTITGSVPHPLTFNSPRALGPEMRSQTHRERTTHIFAAWRIPIPQVEGLEVSVYGGPSYINVTQAMITGVGVAEVGPPFTAVQVADLAVAEHTRNAWGGHVGADVAYMITSVFGLGGFVRFSRGSVDLPSTDEETVSATVGGVQTGGGIRLRF